MAHIVALNGNDRSLTQNQKISKMNLCVKRVDGIKYKAPSQMFEWILNSPLTIATHTEA